MKSTTRSLLTCLFLAAVQAGAEGVDGEPCHSEPCYPDPGYNQALARFNIERATAWANDGYWRQGLELIRQMRYVVRGMIDFPDALSDLKKKWAPAGEELWTILDQKEREFLEVSNRVETARLERRAKDLERLARLKEEIPNPTNFLQLASVTDFAGNIANGLEGGPAVDSIEIYALTGSLQYTNAWANLSPKVIVYSYGVTELLDVLRRGENTTYPTPTIPRGERYRLRVRRGEGDENTMIRTEDPASTEKHHIYHFVPAVQTIDLFVSSEEMNDAYVLFPEIEEKSDSVMFQPGYPTARIPGLGILLHKWFNRLPPVKLDYERKGPPEVPQV